MEIIYIFSGKNERSAYYRDKFFLRAQQFRPSIVRLIGVEGLMYNSSYRDKFHKNMDKFAIHRVSIEIIEEEFIPRDIEWNMEFPVLVVRARDAGIWDIYKYYDFEKIIDELGLMRPPPPDVTSPRVEAMTMPQEQARSSGQASPPIHGSNNASNIQIINTLQKKRIMSGKDTSIRSTKKVNKNLANMFKQKHSPGANFKPIKT